MRSDFAFNTNSGELRIELKTPALLAGTIEHSGDDLWVRKKAFVGPIFSFFAFGGCWVLFLSKLMACQRKYPKCGDLGRLFWDARNEISKNDPF